MSVEQKAIRASYFSIIGNFILAMIKWFAGYFGNSYALIADAIESTTDIVASILVLIGLKVSIQPADDNHPYGHGRIEPLITFIVVGFLIISATIIAYESIDNIRTPHELPEKWTLLVLIGIILWKELSYQYVVRKSNETKSSSLKADAWHHRSDAITSVTAFIGISIALLFGEGYETADDWAALVAAAFILYNCYKIFRPALGEIMDENLNEHLIIKVRNIAKNVDGVIDTEKCFVRKTGLKYFVDLHIIVDSDITVKQGHEIAHKLQDKLKLDLPELENVLIHVEPKDNKY